ncbi:MAG TPA: tetratricopeptide repeat protein [Candidatus Methylacidiphilales bacterium]|jgi:tetratricopeptide (TPR) repeat protein|nr:tetratricopeptide repeat protein [Candidatus Methylacidiphilales bacterium]
MTEPSLHSGRSTQNLKLIESDPLSPASWEGLLEKVRGQNDPLSTKSLEVIIDGLKKIAEVNALAKEQDKAPLRISPLALSMFSRLARAYNSPTLLKEVGLIYLRELGQPSVALQHFERSIRLGGPEKELRPLSEAAAVAVQRQMSQRMGAEVGHSGVSAAQHSKPVATEIIRKTGKMLMPSRPNPAAVTVRVAIAKPEAVESLPGTTQECLDEAKIAIKQGQFNRGAALLRKANATPAAKAEMWQAWTDLGQACFDTGEFPLVEEAFVEALKYDPEELASQFNAALGYQLNKKYDLALATYLKANKLDPKHPKVWCNLGVLYFQTDQYPQAESALRFATMASPEYARAWDNLAAALGAQDKLDEALIACKRAVELRPEYPESFFKMGVIYFSRNNFPLAAAEFKRAAVLPAISAYCDSFQAIIHARLEQVEEAEAAAQRAVRTDPKCDLLWMAWNEIGLAWYSAGNYSRAATAYGEATIIVPEEPQAWFNLGVSFHKLGDLDTARDAYQQAVDLKESFPGAWHNLGIVCAQKGDHQAAMNALRREVNWVPDNIRAWYDLGVTLEKLGREDEARVAFHKVDLLSNAAADLSGAMGEISGHPGPKTGPIPTKQTPVESAPAEGPPAEGSKASPKNAVVQE